MISHSKYDTQKWIVLTGFCLMYATVYLARFNINNLLPEISEELVLSEMLRDILYASIFFSYAIGSIINGYIADKSNKKICILLGIIGSLTLNVISYMASSFGAFLIINMLNGYAQSIIWVSGIAMIAQWWRYDQRGIAVGVINMTSNISYIVLIFAPDFIFVNDATHWKENFIYPMAPIFFLAAIFVIMFAEKPEDRKLSPYTENHNFTSGQDIELKTKVKPSFFGVLKYFLTEKTTIMWCLIALLSSLCRYGLLFWLPAYYSDKTDSFVLSESTTNIVLSLGMGVGTLIGCMLAGKYFSRNLGLVVTIFATSCAAVVITFPVLTSKITISCAVFLCGSLLFAINGILWIYALNKGNRVYSGTISGVLNAFAYFGATVQIFIFKLIVNLTGDWMFVFVAIEVVCILMVILGLVVLNKDKLIRKV